MFQGDPGDYLRIDGADKEHPLITLEFRSGQDDVHEEPQGLLQCRLDSDGWVELTTAAARVHPPVVEVIQDTSLFDVFDNDGRPDMTGLKQQLVIDREGFRVRLLDKHNGCAWHSEPFSYREFNEAVGTDVFIVHNGKAGTRGPRT